MDTSWILSAIFIAILAIIVFAVARGLWRIARGDYEPESGGSWGRQVFGRRRSK